MFAARWRCILKHFLLMFVTVAMIVSTSQVSALQTEEVLDVVAMPLAVAAVSELSGIPAGDLTQLITALNDTAVPPAQFVEIVRYSPVLLVDPATGPNVATFVTNEAARGVTGEELVLALRDRIRASGIEEIDVRDQRRIVLDRREIVPQTVIRHVDEVRNHPHGGPPGQLKKEIGVQTGAEIVHGSDPVNVRDRDRTVVQRSDEVREQGSSVKDKKQGPPDHAAAGKNKGGAKSGGQNHGKAKGKDKNRGER